MNDRQRTVLVVALGLALFVVAASINGRLGRPSGGGWFAYAPNTGVVFDPADPPLSSSADRWRRAGISLGAIATWGAASLWILRRPRSE